MKTVIVSASLLLSCTFAFAAAPGGKALYQDNCASCHGAKGQGGNGPRLVGDASQWPARLFQRAVLSGIDDHGRPLKAAMPHWQNASLKSDHGAAPTQVEIKAIQRYLKQIK
ncbi:c-type cytochrome [Pseudogulbenkiania ferrooxidans]|nr:cytochrome c [Pseudogulbenkiania ferrooxidans]